MKVTSKKLSIMKNFNGLAKSLIIMSERRGPPMQNPAASMRQTITDSKCLAFFKFNQDNAIINSSGEPIKLANLCKDGPNASLKGFSW